LTRPADIIRPVEIAPYAEPAPLGKFDRSVSLLAWAYNEEALLEGFLDQAFELMDATVTDFEVVLIDDGSGDRTAEIADDYARREPRLRVIHHPTNLNVGMATRTAIAATSTEFLFWQTVDWSYDLRNLRIFLELLRHFDVVQGVRPTPIRLFSYVPVIRSIYRVKTRSDTLWKAIISLSNYYLLRILYRVNFHDFQNVTFYPTKLAQSHELVGRSAFVNPELLIRSHAAGARFIEVPIPFKRRQTGKAKGTKLKAVVRAFLDVTLNWLRWGRKLPSGRPKSGDPQQVFRVYDPVRLDEDVIRLVAPLFCDFR